MAAWTALSRLAPLWWSYSKKKMRVVLLTATSEATWKELNLKMIQQSSASRTTTNFGVAGWLAKIKRAQCVMVSGVPLVGRVRTLYSARKHAVITSTYLSQCWSNNFPKESNLPSRNTTMFDRHKILLAWKEWWASWKVLHHGPRRWCICWESSPTHIFMWDKNGHHGAWSLQNAVLSLD
jgi:hypothetical protein